MIVNQLNTSLRGGAAIAAQRLHAGLLEVGVSSRLWYHDRRRGSDDPPSGTASLSFPPGPLTSRLLGAWRRLEIKRQLRARSDEFELYSGPWGRTETAPSSDLLACDALHLHWVNGWLDWPSFFAAIPDDLPIVWTLHDMNPITGGCHHHDGCERFHNQCGNCPQLPNPGPNDISRRGYLVKKQSYSGKNLHIVTPSRWLQRHAERSGLTAAAASIRTIHNGLDVGEFAPMEKSQARRELGLPQDKTIIGFGAACLQNRRKGLPEFLDCVARLKNHSQLLCLGFGGSSVPHSGDRPEFRTTGYLTDSVDLARVYSACDLYVLPSLGENMPQMVIEAMACGTPVAAFDVGGVSEIVIPNVTGVLAPRGDCFTLAEGGQALIDDRELRRKMGEQARRLVVERFSIRKQADAYARLYRSIASQSPTSRVRRSA